METWTDIVARLPAGLTEAQLEAIRQVGARRRHNARIEEARAEIVSIMERIMRSSSDADRIAVRAIVSRGIRRAIEYIGVPGSSCGSAPPGWYRAHPHVGARIAAMHAALADVPAGEPSLLTITASDGHVVLLAEGEEDRVVADITDSAILMEHVLAVAIESRAAAVDAWLLSPDGVMPEPPDASACEEYARLCAARRPPQ